MATMDLDLAFHESPVMMDYEEVSDVHMESRDDADDQMLVDSNATDNNVASNDNPFMKMMVASKRTNPVNNNKYKKRVGAKQAKTLELSENASGDFSPEDATMYRALSARCIYLSQD